MKTFKIILILLIIFELISCSKYKNEEETALNYNLLKVETINCLEKIDTSNNRSKSCISGFHKVVANNRVLNFKFEEKRFPFEICQDSIFGEWELEIFNNNEANIQNKCSCLNYIDLPRPNKVLKNNHAIGSLKYNGTNYFAKIDEIRFKIDENNLVIIKDQTFWNLNFNFIPG